MEWVCPKCNAPAGEHGKGGEDKCQDRGNTCQGLICECMDNGGDEVTSDQPDHGQSFQNPCPYATCYHCGWSGTLPQKPKGLQAWEKKALEAGWMPPEDRKKELGIK